MKGFSTFFAHLVGLFVRPRIQTVEQIHAPIALARGRTPVRVLTTGTGRLQVGDLNLWTTGHTEHNVLVDVHPEVRVHFRNLRGRAMSTLVLEGLQSHIPARLQVRPQQREHMPPWIDDVFQGTSFQLHLRTPAVVRQSLKIPHTRSFSPSPLTYVDGGLPLVRSVTLRPNVHINCQPRAIGADSQHVINSKCRSSD